VPQGVLCKHVFRNNSWSWGVITHLCHRLHTYRFNFFFPEQNAAPPPRDASSPPRAVPPPPPVLNRSRRRPCLLPAAGRTAGIAADEPSAPSSASSYQFRASNWPFPISSSNPRRHGWQWSSGHWRRGAKRSSCRGLAGFIWSVF
jgi:hypothetical protein